MKFSAVLFSLVSIAVASPRSPFPSDAFSKDIPKTPAMNSYLQSLSDLHKAHSHLGTQKESLFFDDDQCATADSPSMAENMTASYTFARYSAAAYCVLPSSLESWSCDSHCQHPVTKGTQDVQVYESLASGTKYFLASNPSLESIIVAFRGTLNPVSLLTDIDFLLSPYDMHPSAPDSATVHEGFLNAYRAVSDDFLSRLRSLVKAHPHFSVVFTGHSMGGSLALLAALHAHAEKVLPLDQIRVFSYGEPRTGNVDFANFVSTLGIKSLTRITYNNDFVPRISPRLLGYDHHRSEVYLTGYLEKDSMASTSKNAWDWFLGWLVSNSRAVTTQTCNDGCGEDSSCLDGVFSVGAVLTHIRVWDVVYGPWC